MTLGESSGGQWRRLLGRAAQEAVVGTGSGSSDGGTGPSLIRCQQEHGSGGRRAPVAARCLHRTVVVPVDGVQPGARRTNVEAGKHAVWRQGGSGLDSTQLGEGAMLPADAVTLEREVREPGQLKPEQEQR